MKQEVDFAKYFLLLSENEFTHEMKRDGITSFHGIHVEQTRLSIKRNISSISKRMRVKIDAAEAREGGGAAAETAVHCCCCCKASDAGQVMQLGYSTTQ